MKDLRAEQIKNENESQNSYSNNFGFYQDPQFKQLFDNFLHLTDQYLSAQVLVSKKSGFFKNYYIPSLENYTIEKTI